MKRRLKAKEPCRLVATQLVEAGVDVDFPEVYRAFAGADSLAQAAGRCNREGQGTRKATRVRRSDEAAARDSEDGRGGRAHDVDGERAGS